MRRHSSHQPGRIATAAVALMAVLAVGCLGIRPAQAQFVVATPDADTVIGTTSAAQIAATEAGVATTVTAIETGLGTVDASINAMDANLTRIMNFPSIAGESAFIGNEAAALPSSDPTATQALQQLPGTLGTASPMGNTIAEQQQAAMLRDGNALTTGYGPSLNDRFMTTINALQGNAVTSLQNGELAAKGYSAMAKEIQTVPSLSASLGIANQLSLVQISRTASLERSVNNNTLATTLMVSRRVQLEAKREADLKSTALLLE